MVDQARASDHVCYTSFPYIASILICILIHIYIGEYENEEKFSCQSCQVPVAAAEDLQRPGLQHVAAMGNQQPSGQRSVSGNDISELASGLSQLAMALQSQNQAQPKAKAMPKAKVAAQPPVPISGDNNQEEAQGEVSLLSFPSFSSWSWSFLSCLPTWPWAAPGPVSATMPLLQASCLLEGGHLCQ